jgi:hypothetical protein
MTRVFSVLALTLWALPWQTAPTTSVRTWLGHTPQIEAHLKTAEVTSLEDIGTGVTRPRRAHLTPSAPVESLVWKVLPPGRRGGFWESDKSEIAAYELDKLRQMDMVPPAVERHVRGDVGAAVMWLEGIRSVKELGGTVPTGVAWGGPIRKMLLFDNLIGNSDRNAGNILIGPPGEMILIDHSRGFTSDENWRIRSSGRRRRFAKASGDPRTLLKLTISGPFFIGSLVSVGSRMTVLGPRLGTLAGALEAMPMCAYQAHVMLR